VNNLPKEKKGSSTGFIPNHVRIRKIIAKNQKLQDFISMWGYCVFFLLKISGTIIMIDIKSPITPPSLLGIDRKIA
jgi:hypothetical protein